MIKIKHIGFVLWVMAMSGCMTKKKAVDYIRATPSISAPLCAELYPVKNIFLPGKDSVRMDTVTVTDTLTTIRTAVINDTVFITEYIPQKTIVTKTITKTDTIVKTDSAAMESMRIKMTAAITEAEKMTKEFTTVLQENIRQRKKISRLISVLVGIGIIIVGGIALKTKKLI